MQNNQIHIYQELYMNHGSMYNYSIKPLKNSKMQSKNATYGSFIH